MPESVRYFRIRNFERFQHYKQRNPPWVKLHQGITADYAFAELPDAAKAHVMLLYLAASRADNRLPFDPAFIAKCIGANEPVNLMLLMERHFIELLPLARRKHVASKALAGRKQSANPETETETETETEGEGETDSGAGAPVGPTAPTTTTATAPRRRTKPTTALVETTTSAAVAVTAVSVTPWNSEACGDWISRFGGTASGARITKALSPLVKREGWDVVRPVWNKYLREKDAEFASAEDFAQRFGVWAYGKAAGKKSLSTDEDVKAFLKGAGE